MFQLIPKEHRRSAAPEIPKTLISKNYSTVSSFWPVFLRRALIFLVLATLAVFLMRGFSTINSDFWRNLKSGEIIWQTGQVYRVNLFSFANPDFPFVDCQWLSEVIYYLLSLAVGIKGLIVFNALLVLTAFALVWRLAWREDYFIFSVLAALLGAGLISGRTDIRPESLGLLLLALFLVIFEKNKERISWSFWLLAPLEILWVNLHFSFFWGLLLFFFFFLDRLWQRRRPVYLLARQKKLDRYIARTALLGILLGAATLVNPNTWRGALYPIYVLFGRGYSIVRDQGLFFAGESAQGPAAFFLRVALVALVISFLMNRKKARPFYLFCSLGLAIMTWKSASGFPWLGLMIIPVLSDNFISAHPRFRRYFVRWEKWRWRGFLRLLTVAFIFVILSTSIYAVATDRFYRGSAEAYGLGLPVSTGAEAAVDFLKQNNIQGPLFNNFYAGGYLIWRLYPEQRVFVDSRFEAYPEDFIQSVYIPMQTDDAAWQKYADEVFGINFVFFAHTDGSPSGREFLRRMAQREEWAMVYLDSVVAVWVRVNEANKSLIDKYSLNQENLNLYVREYLVDSDFWDSARLGYFFRAVQFNDLALLCFDRALQLDEKAEQVWFVGGELYDSKNQTEQAVIYFKKAIELDAKYIDAYLYLGRIYYEQGNFSEARSSWQGVLEIEPNNQVARDYLNNMGLIPFTK